MATEIKCHAAAAAVYQNLYHFQVCFYRRWGALARVRQGRMGWLLVPRAQYKFGTVAPDRPADALLQAKRPWGKKGSASAKAAKFKRFHPGCTACAAKETATGKLLCCCQQCKDEGIRVWYCSKAVSSVSWPPEKLCLACLQPLDFPNPAWKCEAKGQTKGCSLWFCFFGFYNVLLKNTGEVTIQCSSLVHCIVWTQTAVNELSEALRRTLWEKTTHQFQ